MAGKSYIKVGYYDWDRIKKMYIKTGGQTWSAVRKSYVKTSTGWRKVFDTASNRPFIAGNDIPKIRLNTFRTGSTYNPAGTLDDPVDPLVEAPPVQQMGPSWTSPTYGWPYESLGRHLWGYDGTWTSGNGSSMTFTYTWLYNLTGNSNDNTAELNATSTTGRTDMLTNLSSHLGQSDGDYFDKNFLTFRVTATNSAGNASAESAPVYIVREVPTGSITMVSPSSAFTNSSMSATFTYSNNWYNKTDTSNSYIEWFAVNNLGDALTNTNRVQIETLSSIAVSGTTSKSGTTSHVPTIASKYYYVKMTLNNSGTQNAVIAITGFTPKSSVTSQSNKTVVTGAVLDPQAFTTISFTKGFPSSSSQGVVRSTALSWNASTNATRYEIEYEGSNDNSNWTTVQSFASSPYTSSTSQSASWGSPQPVGGYAYYYFMRARIRASNTDSAVTVIGDSGAYRYATGSPPGQPSFGTITTTSTTASIPVTASSTQGSNYRYEVMEYQYRTSFGSYPGSWSTQSLSSGSGTIPLTNLSSNQLYYIKIRNRNFDEEYSSENETNFTTSAALTKLATPTGVNATDARTDGVNVTWNSVSGAAYYGVWYGGQPGYDSLADFGGNRNVNLITGTSYLDTAIGSGVTRDYYVQAYRSGDPTGTKSEWGGPDSGTRAAVITQYTISWNANGGSVSPTSNTVNSETTVSAPTPTRSGYTFLYWRDSPSAFSYIYQINPGGSWTVTSNITFYAYWQVVSVAPSTPTGVSVSGSGVVSWNAVSGADYYEVLNYTDRTGSPSNNNNRLGPYNTTVFATSLQLGSNQGYSSPNNWARAQVRAWNYAGQVSTYSAWYPSSTTYV